MLDVLNLPQNIKFGLEIEFEKALYYKIKGILYKYDNWSIMTDETVCKTENGVIYGGEVVSPILENKDSDWKDIENLCIKMQNCGAKTENLCGGHIHFDIMIFGNNWNEIQINCLRFMKIWYIYQDLIYQFSAGEKNEIRNLYYRYASPFSQEQYQKLLKVKDEISFLKLIDLFTHKMYGLCFPKEVQTNYKCGNKESSFEIRTCNGTLDPILIQNNVNFFAQLLLMVKSNNIDWDIVTYKFINKSYNSSLSLQNSFQLIKNSKFLVQCIYNDLVGEDMFLKQYQKCMI